MSAPELVPLTLDDEFNFGCHRQVHCFNHCCRDLSQALTPYDVLRLREHLKIGSAEFFHRYAVLYSGPATGLPVASLKFNPDRERRCPFVSPEGCQVYTHRPASCRLYPLARGLQRSRIDGTINEHYALIKELHCQGFDQNHRQTVRQWIVAQGLAEYHQMNDQLMELIALKNQTRPGDLSPEHQQLTQWAFYAPDTLRQKASNGALTGMRQENLPPLPDGADEKAWLNWGFKWIRRLLFGITGKAPHALAK